MTSATEVLRRLLDELGVEYTEDRGYREFFWDFGESGRARASAIGTKGLVQMIVTGITPEQAITATLGRDQRNCHNISDFNPVDVFTCSECGSSFKVRQFKIDADGVLDDETEFEFVPMHCPWCGTKVVDE